MSQFAPLDAWVFDLDNTLYPASSSIFPQIDVRMRRFIALRLNLPENEAHVLQKDYYRRFGTTLRGLMLVNHVEPSEFLDYVHQIDHSVLDGDPALDQALALLPGRKLVFTNGSESHAVKVLDRLGIARHFEAIFDIKGAGWVPKPNLECYQTLLARHALNPATSAMVEDLERNLVAPAQLGMTTVWVRAADHPDDGFLPPVPADLSHIHFITDDLAAWLERDAIQLHHALAF